MAPSSKPLANRWSYPVARKDTFREANHGRELADPFHWLEGAEEGEIARWMAAEKRMTDGFFADDPAQTRIRSWLETFLDKPFAFHSFDAGRFRFMLQEYPGKDQPVLLRKALHSGEVRVAVDPNEIAIGGTPAILDQESVAASPDGRFITYCLKTAESVGAFLFVRDVETGALEQAEFPENVLPRVSWHPNGQGFFYNQCQGEFLPEARRAARPDGIYWHSLATSLSSDLLVYEKKWPDAHASIPAVSGDGLFLFVNLIRLVADVCWLRAVPLDERGRPCGAPISLGEDCEAGYCHIGSTHEAYYFETNLDAPNGRVIGFNLENRSAPRMIEVVAEQPLPLCISPRAVRAERSVLTNGKLYLTYLDGGSHVLREHDLNGGASRDLPLPAGTAIAGSGGDRFGKLSVASSGDTLIVDLWRHAAPPYSSIYDIADLSIEPATPDALPRTFADIAVERTRYRSKDGTSVPITILSRRDIPRDGSRPCLLYGYGGWGMSIVPEFGLDIAVWLALGGVYAIANIRGGGEFGAHWHEAGKGANKQNVFDDFIAAAEYLIEQGTARHGCLAIRGLSNGGLLTGACVTQRSDLFGAVICELPLLDPLRMGRDHWSAQIAPELGNPAIDPKAYDVIARYSPLENLRDGVAYPPILVVAADKDAQMLMDGARKFAATLQSDERAGGPYLLHIVRDAAHGGWTKSQQIDTVSREIAFLTQTLDMDTTALGSEN